MYVSSGVPLKVGTNLSSMLFYTTKHLLQTFPRVQYSPSRRVPFVEIKVVFVAEIGEPLWAKSSGPSASMVRPETLFQ